MTSTVLLLGAVPSLAQDGSQARLRLGPLGLSPTISFDGIGIDRNVFNEADNPKRDFTATMRPEATAWLKMGRGLVSARHSTSLLYFRQYASQRTIYSTQEVKLNFPPARFSPYVAGSLSGGRMRPTPEIDERVRVQSNVLTAGSAIRLGVKTALDVGVRRTSMDFGSREVVLGTNLREQLSQTTQELEAGVRHELTPLTRLVFTTRLQRDIFAFTGGRNSKTVAFNPGFEFAPSALLSGKLVVGYRRFDISDSQVEDFSGLVFSVDLAYAFRESTQLLVRTGRDVNYSFSPNEPYYVLTGFEGTVRQRITDRWILTGIGGRQFLDYRQRDSESANTGPSAVPRGRQIRLGGALDYRLSPRAQVGLNVEYNRRPLGIRGEYENLRTLSSVSYRF